MAGTGHAWEVLNLDRVREALAPFAAMVPHDEGKGWFSAPHVIRYVTAETFVAPVLGEAAVASIHRHARDPSERDLLLGKLARGADIRVFVPEFLAHLGPDFRHVVDWLRALPASDPRMVGKLSKVTVTAAIGLADRWSTSLARRAARNGAVGQARHLIDARGGRVWLELLDATALAAESGMMDNCVHSYADRFDDGTRIFSLRDREGVAAVTAEIHAQTGRPRVGQIRARSNRRPGRSLRPDVVALLNHVGATAETSSEAAAMGVILDANGSWRAVEEVAERLLVGGLTCLAYGKEVHVLSSRDPEATLARAIGSTAWWWREERPRFVSLDVAGERRVHVEDQRALARMATSLAARCETFRTSAFGAAGHLIRPSDRSNAWLVAGPEGWVPWVDTLERRECGGVECLVDGDLIHVPRANDLAEILVTVGAGLGGRAEDRASARPSRTLGAAPARTREWAAEDVRRVAAALTALGCESLAQEDGGLRSAGLSQHGIRRWDRFQDHAVERPYLGPTPDGKPLTWRVAPWKGALLDGRGREVFSFHGEDGQTLWTVSWDLDLDHLRDVARLLNELGLFSGSPCLSGSYEGTRWMDVTVRPGDTKGKAAVVVIGGKWTVLTSQAELLSALRSAGPLQFRDAGLTNAALRLLPRAGADTEADPFIARHLAAWSASADPAALSFVPGLGLYAREEKGAERTSVSERMREASGLLHLMGPRERKAVVRAATTRIKRIIGRTRRPGLIFNSEAEVRSAILGFAPMLGTKLLERAVPWVLRMSGIGRSWSAADRTGPWIDIAWLDLDDRLGADAPRARGAITEAARCALWRLQSKPEEVSPRTPGEAEAWLRCARIVMRGSWTSAVSDGMATLVALADEKSGGEEDGWDLIAEEARALAAEVQEREATRHARMGMRFDEVVLAAPPPMPSLGMND